MKRILMVLLTVVMLAAMFAGTACSKGGVDVKGTKEPTVLATEIPTAEPTTEPTEAPTAEPTETPKTVEWYIDQGIAPPEELILVHARHNGQPYGIVEVNGITTLLDWDPESRILDNIWTIPEDFLGATSVYCSYYNGELYVEGYYSSNGGNEFMSLYYEINGKYIYEEITSAEHFGDKLLIGTTDGRAIKYYPGDDFYYVQDFGEGAVVEATECVNFVIDERCYGLDDIDWKQQTLLGKDF